MVLDAQHGAEAPSERLSFDQFKGLLLMPPSANTAAAELSAQINRAQRSAVAEAGEATPLDRSRAMAAKRDAARLFKRAEADEAKAGRVSVADLSTWARRHFAEGLPEGAPALETTPEEWVAAVVKKFDADEDGLLSRHEFSGVLAQLERSGWHAPSVA